MKIRLRSPRSSLRSARRFSRAAAALLAVGVLFAAATFAAAQALDANDVIAKTSAPKSVPRAGKPSGPDPYLSFLPKDSQPDYPAWNRWHALKGKEKRALQPAPDFTRLIVTGESEPNDTGPTANSITGFGTGTGDDPEADISAILAPPPPPTIVGPFAEDNGSIPLAAPTGLTSGANVRTSGTIGDGPYGSGGTGSGDFDFFAIPGLAAGDEILIDVDTPLPFCCDLDPFVAIWDSTGALLAVNDDQPAGGTYDSYLQFAVPAPGTYYVSIGAFTSPFPSNPFDSSSGAGFASEGTYDVTLGVNASDRDNYSIQLEAGDVIAAAVPGLASKVSLLTSGGQLLIGSTQDPTGIEPGPFPGGGPALTYVVPSTDTYTLKVSNGVGAYTLEARVFRPYLEQQALGSVQTLFVDFDGATVDPSIFGNPPGSVALSPLSSFLAGWGLLPSDESAVIDAILAEIEETLSTDMRVLGANGDYDVTNIPGDFDLVILNSRDHADPFGNPHVSRLIIGGTIPELGIGTIGIAQSIDPGNFATSDTAVILLDLLSAPASDPNSLNQFGLAGSATKIDLVGAGVGNIASHEAGHFFANFHTDQFNASPGIMDQGGNLPNIVGVGGDLTLGTSDDFDVDFVADTYVPNEGFTGVEDTLNAVAFGLSTGTLDCPEAPVGTCRTALQSSLVIKDKSPNTQDLLQFKWQRGADTTQNELGDATSSASYRICVYDANGLVRKATAPAGGVCNNGKPCWKTTGPQASPNGFIYRDRARTPSGTSAVTLKSGTLLRPKALWTAKGDALSDGPLGLTTPVVVEVGNSETSVCFGQTFGAPDVTSNSPALFKAATP